MTECFFVSDLHGSTKRYERLFRAILEEPPGVVFLGGDLLPSPLAALSPALHSYDDFLDDYLAKRLEELRASMKHRYPRILLIMGNDDGRFAEARVIEIEAQGLWEYAHSRKLEVGGHPVYGYAYVPPTPFLLKDWERYDVSRFVDPGSVSPEEGKHTVGVSEREVRYCTIQEDLEQIIGRDDVSRAVILFHAPPYRTKLDRAALDGKAVDNVPLDVHVGSIAIRRFIEVREPLLTLHGHIHESARITGAWRDRIGRTHLVSAAHDGPELALVRFDLDGLDSASRELIF